MQRTPDWVMDLNWLAVRIIKSQAKLANTELVSTKLASAELRMLN